MSDGIEQLGADISILRQQLDELPLGVSRFEYTDTTSPRHALETNAHSITDRVHNIVYSRYFRRTVVSASAAAMIVGSVAEGYHVYEEHHTVPNHAYVVPQGQNPNMADRLTLPIATSFPSPALSPEKPLVPEIAPQAPTRLVVPELGIDTKILPLNSENTGQKNQWGGYIYKMLDFPVDPGKQMARYWTQEGEPNTLTGETIEQDPQAVERTIILGHASDIGYDLLFQHLQELKIGDTFTLYTGEYEYTYTVYSTSNPAKNGLDNDPSVYDLPTYKGYKELVPGKEAALVSCLPDSASHSVRIGYLTAIKPIH